ncbi:methyltransferase [Prochlorococcus marinus]|uniref:methyltransferase n=1 Tax=Prochlorococcus marinus TaxID=1219 RepID=UPI0022B362BE|nr:methyltransferase [Prochlorococcus marinus]
MTANWPKLILKNFDRASHSYNQGASLQIFFSDKLAKYCSKQIIEPGLWVDLGSGTGLLADAIEKNNPNQRVLRVDGSKRMLQQHSHNKSTQLFNLNDGLPKWKEPPKLLASSFTLHWLNHPEKRLKEWFAALAPGGWLALALPVKGSFPEWHNAAKRANVTCTAITFPCQNSLLKAIPKKHIKFHTVEIYYQEKPRITSLLKPLVQVGAQASPHQMLTIREWRKLEASWSLSSKRNCFKLSWSIQILLARK